MKKSKLSLLIFVGLIIVTLLCACHTANLTLTGSGNDPSTLKLILLALLALYEVIVRLIPTVSNLSIVGWVIKFLKWLSDALNREKR